MLRSPRLGQRAGLVEQERSDLLADEESGRDGIHSPSSVVSSPRATGSGFDGGLRAASVTTTRVSARFAASDEDVQSIGSAPSASTHVIAASGRPGSVGNVPWK